MDVCEITQEGMERNEHVLLGTVLVNIDVQEMGSRGRSQQRDLGKIAKEAGGKAGTCGGLTLSKVCMCVCFKGGGGQEVPKPLPGQAR